MSVEETDVPEGAVTKRTKGDFLKRWGHWWCLNLSVLFLVPADIRPFDEDHHRGLRGGNHPVLEKVFLAMDLVLV